VAARAPKLGHRIDTDRESERVYRFAPAEIETPRSCHQILGVTRGASAEDLALAFLRTGMACHPANAGSEDERTVARRRLREAAGAWAVLAGRPILGGGDEADMQAMRAFDDALAAHALELAQTGHDADRILQVLVSEGCPAAVAWPAAEQAIARAALLPRPRRAPSAAVPSDPTSARAAAGARASQGRVPGTGGGSRRTSTSAAVAHERRASTRAGARSGSTSGSGAAAGDHQDELSDAGPRSFARRLSDASRALRGLPTERAALQAGEPVEDEPFDDAPPPPDAGIAPRVAATVLDVVLVFVVCAAPVIMLGRGTDAAPVVVERIAIAAMLLGGALYCLAGELAWGGTPGKRLLGMRVETLDGRAPGLHTVLLRHGLRTMSWCLFGLGFLTAPFTERRQALHDLLTETRVVAVTEPRGDLVPVLCALPVAAPVLAYLLSRSLG
jgi:uncharacterized RDD family membrane protein YckC